VVELPTPPPLTAATAAIGTNSRNARARAEDRLETEKETLHLNWDEWMQRMGAAGKSYRMLLVRTHPRAWRGRRAYGPLETSATPMEPQDVLDVHGGGKYKGKVSGPDPDNPAKTRTWEVDYEFEGDPLTISARLPDGTQGAMAIEEAFKTNAAMPASAGDSSLEMMREMMNFMREREDRDRRAIPPPAPPAVDTVELARIASSEKIEAAKIEAARQDRLHAEQQAEANRRHDLEMKKIDAAVETAKVEAQKRADETKEARAATEKLVETINASNKEAISTVTKIVDEIGKRLEDVSKRKEEDVPTQLLKWKGVLETLKGEKEDKEEPGTDIAATLAENIPNVVKLAETYIKERYGKEAPRNPTPSVQPGTTIAVPLVTARATAHVAPQPASTVPDPTFDFPGDYATPEEAVKMLAGNLEKAIPAKWTSQRFFDEVVLKFPAQIKGVLKMAPLDMWFAQIEQYAGEASVLRSPRAKQIISVLHALLLRS
jgi:hypothetical protein